MSNAQAKEEILQDEVNFVAVYQDFALSLIDYIDSKEPYDTMKEYKDLFDAPGVFDGLVNVLI
jgi:hypothetical protein